MPNTLGHSELLDPVPAGRGRIVDSIAVEAMKRFLFFCYCDFVDNPQFKYVLNLPMPLTLPFFIMV